MAFFCELWLTIMAQIFDMFVCNKHYNRAVSKFMERSPGSCLRRGLTLSFGNTNTIHPHYECVNRSHTTYICESHYLVKNRRSKDLLNLSGAKEQEKSRVYGCKQLLHTHTCKFEVLCQNDSVIRLINYIDVTILCHGLGFV